MTRHTQLGRAITLKAGESPQPEADFYAGQQAPETKGLTGQFRALGAGRWEVYYDGDCGFCRRWAARGRRWCNSRIQWLSFREHGDQVAHLQPRFDQAAYLVIDRRLALPGFFAFRKLALASVRLWPLLPIIYFPGSGAIGPMVYRWVAERYGPTRAETSCATGK